ncbi:MAG: Clp protease N-terminal domain-containing protein [Streptosporangiaceae bacterium]
MVLKLSEQARRLALGQVGPGRAAAGKPGIGGTAARKPDDVKPGGRQPGVREAVLDAAAAEAWRRGDRRLGTDHLLLGLLRHGDPVVLRALPALLGDARAAADALDRAALAAVGVQAAAFGWLPDPPGECPLPPLTSGARAILKRAADKARTSPLPGIQARHFLLALLSLDRPDPAAELLVALGIQPWEARNRLIGVGR